MEIKLYNSLTRRKKTLKPIIGKTVGLYTCGPTVYNFAHIGNLRTYIFEDILERTLEYNGYKVKRVMNVTDVGHLTSDADTGEDKLEKEARLEKKSVYDVAKFYTNAFLKDLGGLNIKIPKIIAPATKYIKEQQKIIKRLLENGVAYETDVAVYFDVEKYGLKKYLKLSRQPLNEKLSGARDEVVIDTGKKHPADFVLWFKLAGKFKNHIMRWPSPWGEGFPGWHIECSAISSHFLSQPFDIHTGGVDHIGTHHTNEIAQSEGAYGKPLAKIWMHGEFLVINDSKMAKSEGNFLTLADLEKHGFSPLAFRYLALNAHYRSQLNFNWNNLKATETGLQNLYNHYIAIRSTSEKERGLTRHKNVVAYEKKFSAAINDDLNTSKALSVLFGVIKNKNLNAKEKKQLIGSFDEVLGLNIERVGAQKSSPIPEKIMKIVKEREQYRTRKQFIQADTLRKKLDELGYLVNDTPQGSRVWPRTSSNNE